MQRQQNHFHKKSKSETFNHASFSTEGGASEPPKSFTSATLDNSFKKRSNALSQSEMRSLEMHQIIREEVFDPSLIFVAVHSCCYWDENDRIRKGKIFLTKTEMLFKCSRMPFVRARLLLTDVEEIKEVKNYRNQSQTVLYIQCNNSRNYAFYKFRLPKALIKNRLASMVNNAKKMNISHNILSQHSSFEQEVDEAEEYEYVDMKSHTSRFKRLSKSVVDLKNILKAPRTNQKSNSNSDLVDTEQIVEALQNSNYLNKSASNSYLDNVGYRNPANGVVYRNPDNLPSSKSSSFKKRNMRHIKSTSKDLNQSSASYSPDLDEKRPGMFIKNKGKGSPRSSALSAPIVEPTDSVEDNSNGIQNIITIKNSNTKHEMNKRESTTLPSVSITSFGSSVQYMEINQFNADQPVIKERNSSVSSSSSSTSSSSTTSSSSSSSSLASSSSKKLPGNFFNRTSFKNTKSSFKKENISAKNGSLNGSDYFENTSNNNNVPMGVNPNNQINPHNNSNLLIMFFLFAILIYSLITLVNFVKLCLLESSIKFDL